MAKPIKKTTKKTITPLVIIKTILIILACLLMILAIVARVLHYFNNH